MADVDDGGIELVTADDPTFNLLVFGKPGVGKTTLAATAQDHPKMKNVLFATIEGGMLSVAHRGDIHKKVITSTADLEQLAWRLARGELPSVKTLVVDNITELQTLNLQEIAQDAITGGRNMVKNRARTVDDLWQEDYMRSTNWLKRLFRFLRDLPIHVIYVAHAKYVYPKVPDGVDRTNLDPVAVLPSLTEKLCEATMGYMDFVWCLEQDAKTGKRFLITTSTNEYRCKTRGPLFLDAVGDVIETPTLPEIYDTFVQTALGGTERPKKTKRSA